LMPAFEGQVALVTGAGRGIGAAIAEALAAEGAHVILTARTSSELEAVEERIHAAGGSATIAPLDLTGSDGIGGWRRRWRDAGGRSTCSCSTPRCSAHWPRSRRSTARSSTGCSL